MSGTRKPAEDRKTEIVDTTLRLLAKTPIEKLSTSHIAREIGITQAAIFRHFPTKAALWGAVLETVEARAIAAWDTATGDTPEPMARLRATMRAQLSLIAECPAIPVLIFSAGRITAEMAIHPIHLRIVQGLRMRILDTLRAAASREISTPSPEDGSDLFLGLLQGIVFRWRLTDGGFDLVAEGMRLVDIQIALMTGSTNGQRT